MPNSILQSHAINSFVFELACAAWCAVRCQSRIASPKRQYTHRQFQSRNYPQAHTQTHTHRAIETSAVSSVAGSGVCLRLFDKFLLLTNEEEEEKTSFAWITVVRAKVELRECARYCVHTSLTVRWRRGGHIVVRIKVSSRRRERKKNFVAELKIGSLEWGCGYETRQASNKREKIKNKIALAAKFHGRFWLCAA